jgi:hypothetical protein
LISDPAGNPFGPPQSPKDKARAEIEKEKATKVLDEIVARSHVKVAEDYKVKPPEQQPTQQLPPGFAPPSEQEPAPSTSPAAKPGAKTPAKPKKP